MSSLPVSELAFFRVKLLRTACAVTLLSIFVRLCLWSSSNVFERLDWTITGSIAVYTGLLLYFLLASNEKNASTFGLIFCIWINLSTFGNAAKSGPHAGVKYMLTSVAKILPLFGAIVVSEYWSVALTVLYVAELLYLYRQSNEDSFDRLAFQGLTLQEIFLASVINEINVNVVICLVSCSVTYFLKHVLNKVAEALEIRHRFIANMNHEIRTPLVGVVGITDLLLSSPNIPPELLENLKIAHFSGHGLLALVNNILDLSKMDAKKVQLTSKVFNVRTLVSSVCNMFMATAAAKNVRLRFEFGDLPILVVGDELRLHQILANLVGNACKFTEKGEVVVKATTTLALNDPRESFLDRSFAPLQSNESLTYIRFDVVDTGVGIDDRFHETIFLPFEQIKSNSQGAAGTAQGSGLGLALCKEYVKLMKGKIWVSNNSKCGSTFSFIVPFQRPDNEDSDNTSIMMTESRRSPSQYISSSSTPVQSNQAEQAIAQATKDDQPVLHALIVDDNEVNSAVLHTQLRRFGFRSTLLSNGLQATKYYRRCLHAYLDKNPSDQLDDRSLLLLLNEDDKTISGMDISAESLPVVIFMDHNMPVMNGCDATRKIREMEERFMRSHIRTRVVALTASDAQTGSNAFFEAGADAFLTKPVTLAQLRKVLHELLPTTVLSS